MLLGCDRSLGFVLACVAVPSVADLCCGFSYSLVFCSVVALALQWFWLTSVSIMEITIPYLIKHTDSLSSFCDRP